MGEKVNLPKMSKPVITLLVSLVALGVGEYLSLPFLTWVGIVLSVIAGFISSVVLFAYAVEYWQKKVCNIAKEKDNHNSSTK